jgi:fermentation-respiration switch protein FrsA (DUF1100 family)
MKKFTVVSLLCLVFLSGCGYGVRYVASKAFYQGGQEFDETPEDRGLPHVVAEFENTDGDTLHGWVVPGKEGYPIIIYFHGNVSNVTHGLEKIEMLNSLGFSVFSFEYRGYGKSEGRPLYEDDFYRDARSALWWLHRMGWDNSKIIYYGHSLGAGVALNLALEEPPAGVILESAFTSYAGMLKYKAPFLYMIGGWKASEFSNISKIPKLKSPVILFHGTSDLIVPSEMSQRLYDAAQPPKKLYLVNGASHVNAMYLARKDLSEDLKEFLPDRGEPVSFQ